MAMIGSGNFSNLKVSEVLSKLGLEMNILQRDLEATAAGFPAMAQSLQSLLAGMGAQPGSVGRFLTKAAFISALHEAIDKARKNPQFNLETAINDLWIHFDAVRKFSTAASPAAIDGEAKRLQGMMQKRAQLFSVLGELMKQRDQMQKSVIQNLR